jgi:hypothetical protein
MPPFTLVSKAAPALNSEVPTHERCHPAKSSDRARHATLRGWMNITEFTACKLANVDRAAADQRLSHLDFRLLWLLVSAADRKTGIARRKQTDLAQMLGIHRRTVQRCRDRLVSFGYVKPIGQEPGGYVSGYNVVMAKKAALVSKKAVRKPHMIPCHPLMSLRAREPRRAEEALGPALGADLRKRIGAPNFEAWFVKGEAALVDQSADTVTIAVSTQFFAIQIRNRFESDLVACSGAARVNFVFRKAGPPTERARSLD